MLKKIVQTMYSILLISLCIIVTFIVLNGILVYDKVIYTYNAVFLIIAILVYMFIIKVSYKYIIPRFSENKKIVYLIFAIFTVGCIFCGIYFKVNPSWDMGNVFNIAKDYTIKGSTDDIYLYTFPNNIMLVFVYQCIFIIFKLININDFLTIATIFNSLIVAATGILAYFNTKKIFDNSKALMALIIVFMTTPLYLYCVCYYSDTLSMFLVMVILALYLKIKNNNNLKESIALQILFAFAIFLGMKIKITSIFILIAICVYNLVNFNINIKNFFKKFGISILIIILLSILFNTFIEPIYISDKKILDANKIPIEHWIMMGLDGKGSFSREDYQYTQSFPTLTEKKQATKNGIKERIIQKFYDKTLIKHLCNKLINTWSDGSYFSPEVISREPVKNRIINEYIFKDSAKNGVYKYFPQCMHFSMLIFIILNIYRVLKSGDYLDKDNIIFIALFGLIFFLLMWESRSRYILTNLPLIIMAQLGGIEYFSNKKSNKKEM